MAEKLECKLYFIFYFSGILLVKIDSELLLRLIISILYYYLEGLMELC